MGVSTHVLDAARGRPAAGVGVCLEYRTDAGAYAELARATTNDDGRIPAWPVTDPGTYRLVFDTGTYFAAHSQPAFYPEVTVTFAITEPAEPHHVPLLLSPFAYSTYRGS